MALSASTAYDRSRFFCCNSDGGTVSNAGKFQNPHRTLSGEDRAVVPFSGLRTLWVNTGTLCNITCAGCYIESSPRNDRLVWFPPEDLAACLAEAATAGEPLEEIGFTGGEPFMHPRIIPLLRMALDSGKRVLVLTNAMKPLHHHLGALVILAAEYGNRLTLRVSLDHYTQAGHEAVRGAGTWEPALHGLSALAEAGIRLSLAGRMTTAEPESVVRAGYAALCRDLRVPVDVSDRWQMVLFPEIDETVPVPEITTACWGILGKTPEQMMCASSRMVVRRRGADRPSVVACTLLPYDLRFDLGETLAGARGAVALNHPHCAKFCVLGGAACSG